ncbi:hypothetical protein [Anatilimnocola floriformis]|uniref:hypothetical protein n=1 Tax=Anatilimnocola floriformis TaxID=2948575 RepID=UPI0020C5863A|nr:hypothetical protein [Anatilimnocola floriformis]
MTRTEREHDVQLSLLYDRNALIHDYRAALHLHGDPADSENESREEMLRAIADQVKAGTSAGVILR